MDAMVGQGNPPEGEENIDPENLTVEEIRAEIKARQQIIDEVTETIDENDLAHRSMDQALRRELLQNRNRALRERKVLTAILNRKTGGDERRARREAWEHRNRTRCELFVKSAKAIIGDEQFAAVWAAAKNAWPDHPAWGDVE